MAAPLQPLEVIRSVDQGVSLRLVGLLTMTVVVFNTSHDGPLFLAAAVGLGATLLHPSLLVAPWWWLTLSCAMGARFVSNWEGIDDHVVLTAYWCLAFGLCLLATNPMDALARSGRWLVGCVFLFAAGWKTASTEFVNGDFFRFTLLFDERFESLTKTVGGLAGTDYDANLQALSSLVGASTSPAVAQVTSTPAIGVLAMILAVGTLVIEWFLAVVYLGPLPARVRWLRPFALLSFCAATYLLVPVSGFGTVLLVMTLPDQALSRSWRRAILIAFGLLMVYPLFWQLVLG